ncbi:MAG: isoleucine--tRNA ligase [Hyphomicrobiales bacterium]|nr:isoleucine--tRNA ligase [Hyphomicrobiales bacterium]MCY4032461.1 isoleucine--tRNA ligase [Hyphomicrobiales bacterium]
MASDTASDEPRDYRDTLLLPRTDFSMKANLPRLEPELLEFWKGIGFQERLQAQASGREKFILHDGPPYANGHLHIGSAFNKILKDAVVRSRYMLDLDCHYVPGWDCHGLPIEWQVEKQYRDSGRNKDDVPVLDFRAECRAFAQHWMSIQMEEFKRLGVEGNWKHPYVTMAYESEAAISAEFHDIAMRGLVYRGSKPVMWSVVEKTALAEAEVEYQEYTSNSVWVKFPVVRADDDILNGAHLVIWTTTPWTIPANRAIACAADLDYGIYEYGGGRIVVAKTCIEAAMAAADVADYKEVGSVSGKVFASGCMCAHPLRDAGLGGYGFDVPLLHGDYVTDKEGTGFVHTAPGHGREDFEAWMEYCKAKGVAPDISEMVDADGIYTEAAAGFAGKRILTSEGERGDAEGAVVDALDAAGMLLARAPLRHQYPHSWRSKTPVLFRNTPQWFIALDQSAANMKEGGSLRQRALDSVDATRFYPDSEQNRLRDMVSHRPDWVISRQRAWGVPLTIFRNRKNGVILPGLEAVEHYGEDVCKQVRERIKTAFEVEGSDAWFAPGARERFLDGLDGIDPQEWEQVNDILDVWFESGATHAFVLEQREELVWPAALYLEGTDQHRGWFQSSLLESCATRGRAPYDAVLTHGFVVDGDGRKMSKSLGNTIAPQEVVEQHGADILRLWALGSDYTEELRISNEILKSSIDSYRKLRNGFRFMLGNLHGFDESERIDVKEMPELERWLLHRLWEMDKSLRENYKEFAFQKAYRDIFHFMTLDLSAFYFDVRKDSLYCDAVDDPRRRSCRTLLDELFRRLNCWLAPLLCFTMEEAHRARYGDAAADASVHLQTFPETPSSWREDELGEKWRRLRRLRRVATGALEVERREKRIGSSLEAAPCLFLEHDEDIKALEGIDLAELLITSSARWEKAAAPAEAFCLPEVSGVGVVVGTATGNKCRRCWKILPEVGTDPDYPDLSGRDADVVRKLDAATS